MSSGAFPRFTEGNVEIHFSKRDEKWVLRCEQLDMHSAWFKQALSDKWRTGVEPTLFNGKNH